MGRLDQTRDVSPTPAARRAALNLGLALAAALPARALAAQAGTHADPRIDTVIVVSHNVFDPPDGTPRLVAKLGNALHVTTRTAVIRRLLLVGAGSPLDSARLVESERALRELGVFRSVRLDTLRVDDRLALRVETADGWSTSPQLNFASSAGSTTWSAAMVERNFLGLATLVSVSYGATPDRHSLDLQFASPGFVFRHAPLIAVYSHLSDGDAGQWGYGLPFYRTDARWALFTTGEAANQRTLDFHHPDTTVVVDTAIRHALVFSLVGGAALHATSRSYVRAWAGATWRRENYESTPPAPVPYSTFWTIGAGIDAGRVRYGVFQHLNGFARQEDVDLSSAVSLRVWVAPRAWGYAGSHAGIGPALSGQVATRWSSGLALLRADAHGVFGRAGLDSGQTHASLDLASLALANHVLLAHLEGGAMEGQRRGTAFDLWATLNGPRGFGAHEFTGTRFVYAMLEDRLLLADQLWGVVGLGLAPYLEYGGAWYGGLEPARLGGDAGLALRIGSPRSVRGDVGEFAVSYRYRRFAGEGPWALTVRKSFALK
jgi:hypothetical protein